jgi:hypothetical protein
LTSEDAVACRRCPAPFYNLMTGAAINSKKEPEFGAKIIPTYKHPKE